MICCERSSRYRKVALLYFKADYLIIQFLFFRYLIEKDYPGMMIGPEPTTDKFVIIAHNKEEGKVKEKNNDIKRNKIIYLDS